MLRAFHFLLYSGSRNSTRAFDQNHFILFHITVCWYGSDLKFNTITNQSLCSPFTTLTHINCHQHFNAIFQSQDRSCGSIFKTQISIRVQTKTLGKPKVSQTLFLIFVALYRWHFQFLIFDCVIITLLSILTKSLIISMLPIHSQ